MSALRQKPEIYTHLFFRVEAGVNVSYLATRFVEFISNTMDLIRFSPAGFEYTTRTRPSLSVTFFPVETHMPPPVAVLPFP